MCVKHNTSLSSGVCRPGWAGPAKGDLGGEEQGDEACVKVLQNDGAHYTDLATCRSQQDVGSK